MTADLFDLWKRQAALASGFAAMGPSAGFIVVTRLTQMAMEGGSPSAAGAAETRRMMSEKVSAIMEGGVAAGLVMSEMAFASGPLAAAGIMVSAGEAAMRPASRTVRANVRRLSRANA